MKNLKNQAALLIIISVLVSGCHKTDQQTLQNPSPNPPAASPAPPAFTFNTLTTKVDSDPHLPPVLGDMVGQKYTLQNKALIFNTVDTKCDDIVWTFAYPSYTQAGIYAANPNVDQTNETTTVTVLSTFQCSGGNYAEVSDDSAFSAIDHTGANVSFFNGDSTKNIPSYFMVRLSDLIYSKTPISTSKTTLQKNALMFIFQDFNIGDLDWTFANFPTGNVVKTMDALPINVLEYFPGSGGSTYALVSFTGTVPVTQSATATSSDYDFSNGAPLPQSFVIVRYSDLVP